MSVRRTIFAVSCSAFLYNVYFICKDFITSQSVVTYLSKPFDTESDQFYPDVIICSNFNLKQDLHNYVNVSELDQFSYLAVEIYKQVNLRRLFQKGNLSARDVPEYLIDAGYFAFESKLDLIKHL